VKASFAPEQPGPGAAPGWACSAEPPALDRNRWTNCRHQGTTGRRTEAVLKGLDSSSCSTPRVGLAVRLRTDQPVPADCLRGSTRAWACRPPRWGYPAARRSCLGRQTSPPCSVNHLPGPGPRHRRHWPRRTDPSPIDRRCLLRGRRSRGLPGQVSRTGTPSFRRPSLRASPSIRDRKGQSPHPVPCCLPGPLFLFHCPPKD
jgi:hypothetical protein